MTTKLRWHKIDPPPGGAIRALGTGDAGEHGYLIQIRYDGRIRDLSGGWTAKYRTDDDTAFDDGFMWSTVMVPDADAPGGMATIDVQTEASAKEWVADQWEYIERQARDALDGVLHLRAERARAEEEHDAPIRAVHDAAVADNDDLVVSVSDRARSALTKQFGNSVRDVATQLRRLADRVEEQASASPSLRDSQPDHSRLASEVLAKVTWGVANLHIDRLVRDAADLDRLIREVS